MKKQIIMIVCGIAAFLGYKLYKEERDHKRLTEEGDQLKAGLQFLDDIISEDERRTKEWVNSLEGSIKLARKVGVPEEQILHNLDEVDAFFMN